MASAMASIPAFHSKRAVLLVEGQSEKTFLDKMRETRFTDFLDKVIEVYGGSGNRSLRRVEMLLAKYKRDGYRICIQGDADGKGNSIFDRLVAKALVAEADTFIFDHDFETSVPPGVMWHVLQTLDLLKGVSLDDFVASSRECDGSRVAFLKSRYGLDLGPKKTEFARGVAAVLNESGFVWWQHEGFLKTELGRFLEFVRRAF